MALPTASESELAALMAHPSTLEVFELLHGGYWVWNLLDNSLFLSPKLKSELGYKDSEINNSISAWLALLHAEDIAPLQKSLYDHTNSKGLIPFDNQVRYLAKDGLLVHVWCKGMVIEWTEDEQAKKMIGYHLNINDILPPKE